MDQNVQKDSPLVLGCVGVIALVLFLSLFRNCGSNQSSQPNTYQPRSSQSRTSRPRIGENAMLSTGSGSQVLVGATAKDLERCIEFGRAGDSVGIREMTFAKLAWSVPNGTKCKVIKSGITTYEVRLTEGKHNGQICYVLAAFVKRK